MLCSDIPVRPVIVTSLKYRCAIDWAVRHSDALAFILVGMVFLAGLVYSGMLGDELRYADETDYVVLARNLADHGIFSRDGETHSLFRPPGYPALLAGLRSMGAGPVGYRVFNFAVFGGSVLLIYFLLKPVSRMAGIIAVALACGYPVFFYAAGTLFPQTIASMLLLAALYFSPFNGRMGAIYGLMGGMCFGAILLIAPQMIVVPVIYGFWIVIQWRRRAIGHFLVCLAACLLIITPWILRNYAVSGRFVFISANSGLMLLMGNNENASANSGPTSDIEEIANRTIGMGDYAANRYLKNEALRYMRENPVLTIKMYGLKFLNYFNYRNDLSTVSESSSIRDMAVLATYWPILCLVVFRLLACRSIPLSALEWFGLALYLCAAAFDAMFFTRIRYRIPYDFILVLLAAHSLARIGDICRSLMHGKLSQSAKADNS